MHIYTLERSIGVWDKKSASYPSIGGTGRPASLSLTRLDPVAVECSK